MLLSLKVIVQRLKLYHEKKSSRVIKRTKNPTKGENLKHRKTHINTYFHFKYENRLSQWVGDGKMPVREDEDTKKMWWFRDQMIWWQQIKDGGDSSQGGWCIKKAISHEVLKMNGESAESIKSMFLFTREKVDSRILHSKWSLKKCLLNWESIKKTVDNKEMNCLGFLPRLSGATCNFIMEVVRPNRNSR